jgi:hypothetical protein
MLHYVFSKLLVNRGIRVGFVWHECSTRVNRHCHSDHGQSVDEGGVTASPLLCKTSTSQPVPLFRQRIPVYTNEIDSIRRKFCNRMINVRAVLDRRWWMLWTAASACHPLPIYRHCSSIFSATQFTVHSLPASLLSWSVSPGKIEIQYSILQ